MVGKMSKEQIRSVLVTDLSDEGLLDDGTQGQTIIQLDGSDSELLLQVLATARNMMKKRWPRRAAIKNLNAQLPAGDRSRVRDRSRSHSPPRAVTASSS